MYLKMRRRKPLTFLKTAPLFAGIQGNFELSESYEHKLYKLACDTYGNISVEAGKAALRVAAVYHNQGNYPAAKLGMKRDWKSSWQLIHRAVKQRLP